MQANRPPNRHYQHKRETTYVISSVSLVSFIAGPRALLNAILGLAPDGFFSPPCSISPNLNVRSGLGVVLPGVTLHRQVIMAPNATWGNLESHFEAISKYCCDLKVHTAFENHSAFFEEDKCRGSIARCITRLKGGKSFWPA